MKVYADIFLEHSVEEAGWQKTADTVTVYLRGTSWTTDEGVELNHKAVEVVQRFLSVMGGVNEVIVKEVPL